MMLPLLPLAFELWMLIQYSFEKVMPLVRTFKFKEFQPENGQQQSLIHKGPGTWSKWNSWFSLLKPVLTFFTKWQIQPSSSCLGHNFGFNFDSSFSHTPHTIPLALHVQARPRFFVSTSVTITSRLDDCKHLLTLPSLFTSTVLNPHFRHSTSFKIQADFTNTLKIVNVGKNHQKTLRSLIFVSVYGESGCLLFTQMQSCPFPPQGKGPLWVKTSDGWQLHHQAWDRVVSCASPAVMHWERPIIRYLVFYKNVHLQPIFFFFNLFLKGQSDRQPQCRSALHSKWPSF